VKSIGVVSPHFPSGASVVRASSVGQSFGLVGGLVELGLQAGREAQFKTVLEQQKFSAESHFVASLTDALRARGYEVTIVPLDSGKAVKAELDTGAPCLAAEGTGAKSVYAAIRLPSSEEPYLLSVTSMPQGALLREVPRESFVFRGTTLHAGVRARPGAEYLAPIQVRSVS
jgi:hypothetical protein